MKCSTALTSYQSARFVARVKGGLIGLVYQETMKARTADLGETTAIALMGIQYSPNPRAMGLRHRNWRGYLAIGTTGLLSLFSTGGRHSQYVYHSWI